MNKIYCVLMSREDQIKNKYYSTDKNKPIKGINIGDYAFIRQNNRIIELWRAKEWANTSNENSLVFEKIYHFEKPIDVYNQFICLNCFKLTTDLLIKTHRPIANYFAELVLTDNKYLDVLTNKNSFENFLNNENNYRKIIICDNKNQIDKSSNNIQLYKDNNMYHLFPALFMDTDTIINKFNNANYLNGRYSDGTKGKLYENIECGQKIFTRKETSIVGFYDLFISSIDNGKNKRKDFIDWCIYNNETIKNAKNHEKKLRNIEDKFKVNIDEEYKKDTCKKLLETIGKNEGEKNWLLHLKKYIEFKTQRNINKNEQISETDSQPSANTISEEMQDYLKSNTIFYGVPGCGKSYKINKLLSLDKHNEKHLDNKYYKRILFHPEYSYSDFVGQVMPTTNSDKIEYKFKAGPFVEILCNALKDEDNNYFLIIEEINRGNAPAIFGDIFQLLDRNNDGESEYPIDNSLILSYFKENGISEYSVKIPSNLTILATMNTCDQNVFTLDTAFKRRWRMSRIENNFDDKTQEEFFNTKINTLNITWKEFATAFNSDLLKSSNDGIIAEDKQLGTHFVSLRELNNKQYFAEKVFMYIWNDVVKYNKEQLFSADYKTLDSVIEAFCSSKNVFNESCEEIQKLYKKAEQQNITE